MRPENESGMVPVDRRGLPGRRIRGVRGPGFAGDYGADPELVLCPGRLTIPRHLCPWLRTFVLEHHPTGLHLSA